MFNCGYQTQSNVAVAYLRCSTEEQNKSGLGLSAQRDAIQNFCMREGITLAEEFVEVQSGKDDSRPELQRALASAKKNGGFVIVSKICRLSRKVSYIANLLDEGIPFVCVELGRKVDAFVIHLWSAFAQAELSKISQRTKEALAQKKLQGVKLGNPRYQEALPKAWEAKKGKADAFALSMKASIELYRKAGMTSYTAIAKSLNERNQKTRTGRPWAAQSVKNLIRRLDALEAI